MTNGITGVRLVKEVGADRTRAKLPRLDEWFILSDGSELSLLVEANWEGAWNLDTRESVSNALTVADAIDYVGAEHEEDVLRMTRDAVHFYVDHNASNGLTLLKELAEYLAD